MYVHTHNYGYIETCGQIRLPKEHTLSPCSFCGVLGHLPEVVVMEKGTVIQSNTGSKLCSILIKIW